MRSSRRSRCRAVRPGAGADLRSAGGHGRTWRYGRRPAGGTRAAPTVDGTRAQPVAGLEAVVGDDEHAAFFDDLATALIGVAGHARRVRRPCPECRLAARRALLAAPFHGRRRRSRCGHGAGPPRAARSCCGAVPSAGPVPCAAGEAGHAERPPAGCTGAQANEQRIGGDPYPRPIPSGRWTDFRCARGLLRPWAGRQADCRGWRAVVTVR